MNHIKDNIWIGSSQDAKNLEAIKAAGITHILNCAEDLDPAFGWKDGITCFHVGLRDDSNSPYLYIAGVNILNAIRGKNVLVHCHEGRSRSVWIVACHLAQDTSTGPKDWVEFIRSRGRDCAVHKGHTDSYNP